MSADIMAAGPQRSDARAERNTTRLLANRHKTAHLIPNYIHTLNIEKPKPMCVCRCVCECVCRERKCVIHICTCVGIFAYDCTKNAGALYVFVDVRCVVAVASNDLFFPITPLHTCGSFTFMVIQIMKLSIRGILWWEQWTQLPPAACEMGWQTLRQMGEAALGRQSNHIHRACFPFPLFMCSAATYQQAGAKEPGIITSHTPTVLQTHTCTNTFP